MQRARDAANGLLCLTVALASAQRFVKEVLELVQLAPLRKTRKWSGVNPT